MESLVIGGNGYIASRLKGHIDATFSSKRINTMGDIMELLDEDKPKCLINCIGFNGRINVDHCERHLDKTLFTNTYMPVLLAEACLRSGVKLVHISTGCMYHGTPLPIDESQSPDFMDLYYSRSKIYAELSLAPLLERSLVLRLRIPLDNCDHPKSLLSKLIQYKKVLDVPNSVTYIPDFVRATKHLIDVGATGVYNVTNKGALYYPDLMEVYRKYVPKFEYEVISYEEMGLVRTNVVLSTDKLEGTGFPVRHINDVLEEAVKGYIETDRRKMIKDIGY